MADLSDVARLNLLIETLTDFASVSDRERLITSLAASARFLISFSRCVILLGKSVAQPSRIAVIEANGVSKANLDELLPVEVTLATRALNTMLPAVDDLRRPGAACYPLASLSTPFGVLIFTGGRVTYTMADLRIVQALADACASVIARIEMGGALQAMADERGLALANEQEAHARADATNRAKDEFLATLSHEMRTPLNAILGWAQTLQRTPPTAQRLQQGLAAIERCANDQRRLIEDLLDTARIVSGHFRLDMAAIDLRTVIDDAVSAIVPAAEAKRLVIAIDADQDVVMRGDAPRLQQVLWNLLANAVKFTPPAGAITVVARRTPESISIQVTDTGVGIPPELLPWVFDRFRQGDGSPSRLHGGLGLGLSIVRHIAELHGGTVVASSPGCDRGTTVTVTLPVFVDETRPVPMGAL